MIERIIRDFKPELAVSVFNTLTEFATWPVTVLVSLAIPQRLR